jgi:hypothetical protein
MEASPIPPAMILTLVSVASLTIAGCTRDTTAATQPTTLMGRLPIAALHIDAGGGVLPANGRPEQVSEGRYALAICRWPSVTVAFVSALSDAPSTTSFVVPGSGGDHPQLFVRSTLWEIEQRWRDSSIFHPMLVVGVGVVKAQYEYSHKRADGTWERVVEGPGTAPVYSLAFGLEASIFKYVSLYTLMGVRRARNLSLVGVEPGGFSGGYTAIGMGFGKFR